MRMSPTPQRYSLSLSLGLLVLLMEELPKASPSSYRQGARPPEQPCAMFRVRRGSHASAAANIHSQEVDRLWDEMPFWVELA